MYEETSQHEVRKEEEEEEEERHHRRQEIIGAIMDMDVIPKGMDFNDGCVCFAWFSVILIWRNGDLFPITSTHWKFQRRAFANN